MEHGAPLICGMIAALGTGLTSLRAEIDAAEARLKTLRAKTASTLTEAAVITAEAELTYANIRADRVVDAAVMRTEEQLRRCKTAVSNAEAHLAKAQLEEAQLAEEQRAALQRLRPEMCDTVPVTAAASAGSSSSSALSSSASASSSSSSASSASSSSSSASSATAKVLQSRAAKRRSSALDTSCDETDEPDAKRTSGEQDRCKKLCKKLEGLSLGLADKATVLQKVAELLRKTAKESWQQPMKHEEVEQYMQRYRADIDQGQAFVDAVVAACEGIWTDPRHAATFVRKSARRFGLAVRPDELADCMQLYKAYCDAGYSWQTALSKVTDDWFETNVMKPFDDALKAS